MYNISIFLKIVSCFFVALLLAFSPFHSLAGESTSHPIVRPDRKTLDKWFVNYSLAPKAVINPLISKNLHAATAAFNPTSIDQLDRLQYTPSESDQGQCGNCWAWAGTGVIELALYENYGIKDRLSIEFQDVCHEFYPQACSGCEFSNLRNFRDAYLIPNAFGQTLVNLYYRYSPPIAHLIQNSEPLRLIVRGGLLPVIAFSYGALHYGLAATVGVIILGMLLTGALFVFRRKLTCFMRRK